MYMYAPMRPRFELGLSRPPLNEVTLRIAQPDTWEVSHLEYTVSLPAADGIAYCRFSVTFCINP